MSWHQSWEWSGEGPSLLWVPGWWPDGTADTVASSEPFSCCLVEVRLHVLGSSTGMCFRGVAPNSLLRFSWAGSEAFSHEWINLWIIDMRLERSTTGYLVHLLSLGREGISCPCLFNASYLSCYWNLRKISNIYTCIYTHVGEGRESSWVEPGVWNARTVSSLNLLEKWALWELSSLFHSEMA